MNNRFYWLDRWGGARRLFFPLDWFTSATAIEAMLAEYKEVIVPPGIGDMPIQLDRGIVMPAGTTLIPQVPGVSGFRLADSSGSRWVVKAGGDRCNVIDHLILDGNLDAREANGALTDYVFAMIVEDCKNCYVEPEWRDCGSTDADWQPSPGQYAGNGGGVLLSMTTASAANMTGNTVRGKGYLPKGGFFVRLATPFKSPAGAYGTLVNGDGVPIFLTRNRVEYIDGRGTRKNGIELVGAATTGNVVADGTITDPKGQATVEFDFGANWNVVERFTAHFSHDYLLERSHDCFNQVRSNNADGSRTFNNSHIDCSVEFYGRLSGAASLSGFMERGQSTNWKIIRPTMKGHAINGAFRTAEGATGVTTLYLNQMNYGEGRNTYIEQPLCWNTSRAIKMLNTNDVDQITVDGGHLFTRGALYEQGGAGRVGKVAFRGSAILQTMAASATAGATLPTPAPVSYGADVIGPLLGQGTSGSNGPALWQSPLLA